MQQDLFDRRARRLRFARAFRRRDPFLLDRAFDDCLERLAAIDRPRDHLLFVGPAFAPWVERLRGLAGEITLLDPAMEEEDQAALPQRHFDAVLAVGSLDSVNGLPAALAALVASLKPDSPLIGALIGGHSFPALRDALIHADRGSGAAAPRSHPRITAQSLAGLLQAAGLAMPVVDVDRLAVRYSSLGRLVADLRSAAATNFLAGRPRGYPGRRWAARLADRFAAAAGPDGRTLETVETLHFLAWSRPN